MCIFEQVERWIDLKNNSEKYLDPNSFERL